MHRHYYGVFVVPKAAGNPVKDIVVSCSRCWVDFYDLFIRGREERCLKR